MDSTEEVKILLDEHLEIREQTCQKLYVCKIPSFAKIFKHVCVSFPRGIESFPFFCQK